MNVPPLNPAQRSAVEHQNGPLLVLAGAGSGKTRVITHRIARLVERGVPAKAICALTFTNKAAGEMAERVVHAMGITMGRSTGGAASSTGRQVLVSTFHSFGLRVLTRERSVTGGTFTIFDQGDCLGLVKELLRNIGVGKNFDASAVVTRISNAKNAFKSADELQDEGNDEYDEITKLVYPKYQSALRNFRAYDFDDLVCEVARIWKSRADILSRWQQQFRYLLVDEYQDTNRAQLEMLRLLAAEHRNLCVVGDDDQSIYAWRGADVRNILDFEEHFPGAKVVKLEQNYRSRSPIIAVANAVIERRADQRHRKTLFTERGGDSKVSVCVAATSDIEAAFVGREVRRIVRDEGKRAKEVAVLYRSNGQSKAVEEALREQGIPHRVVGGQQFFERKEVKDILSFLKLALNRSDEISLRRVMNYPARGIGDTSVERLTLHAVAKGWTLWEAVERVDALNDISSVARDGCKSLEKVVAEIRKRLLVDRARASDVARELSDRVGIKSDIMASSGSPQIAGRRWSNVESLFATFRRREARAESNGLNPSAEDALAAFLHALTLNFNDDEEDKTDVVTLSTLHGAKGLEFDHVFLIGCEEGFLPHTRTIESRVTDAAPGGDVGGADVEEERRLFYVGVTRARETLVLARAKTRGMRGRVAARTASRFLLEIPAELLDEREVRDEPAMSMKSIEESANALLAALDSIG